MYVIVAGCGRVGSRLAERLSYEGHDVVVIDRDPDSFRRLGGTFNGITLVGMAFDMELLGVAGIKEADVFLAVTNYDNTNLMAAEIASKAFKVPLVLARMYNPDKRETFRRLGVDFICGTTMVAERLREMLLRESMNFLLEDPERDVWVVEVQVGEGGRGGSFQVDRDEGRVLALYRKGEFLPEEGISLEDGDTVVLVLRRKGLAIVEDLVGGRKGAKEIARPHGRVSVPGISGDRVIITGCGRVGAQLAEMISLDGFQVTIIDKDRNSFRRLSKAFMGEVMEGFAYDDEILRRVGIGKARAFAAVTNYDNTNLMAAEVVKHVFGVPRVVARMFNPDKEETFRALGVDYVCGTEVVAQAIMERIYQPSLRKGRSCCNNSLLLVNFNIPRKWEGKNIRWLVEEFGLRVSHVERDGKALFPGIDHRLEEGEKVTGLMSEKAAERMERKLRVEGRAYTLKRARYTDRL